MDVVVVGASGYGREISQYVIDIAAVTSQVRLRGLLDDNSKLRENYGAYKGLKVIGDTYSYEIQKNDRFVISILEPDVRFNVAKRLADRGAQFFTVIHPSAYIAPTAKIGPGCIISPFASVGSYAQLEEHVTLVMYAAVGHDSYVGPFASFCPFAVANGGSVIGAKVFVGSHAVITPTKRIGAECRVAANSVVYRSVPDRSLAIGNPAKISPLMKSK